MMGPRPLQVPPSCACRACPLCLSLTRCSASIHAPEDSKEKTIEEEVAEALKPTPMDIITVGLSMLAIPRRGHKMPMEKLQEIGFAFHEEVRTSVSADRSSITPLSLPLRLTRASLRPLPPCLHSWQRTSARVARPNSRRRARCPTTGM